MTNATIIGVTLSLAGVIGGFVCFILCKVYRKRKHRHNIPSYTGYDAVGDYKPPSLMSISTASQVTDNTMLTGCSVHSQNFSHRPNSQQ